MFVIATFRIKNMHYSANEQVKMQRLNQLNQMRDQLEADSERTGIIKAKVKKSSAGSTLKTPLLVDKEVKYSDKEDHSGLNIRIERL